MAQKATGTLFVMPNLSQNMSSVHWICNTIKIPPGGRIISLHPGVLLWTKVLNAESVGIPRKSALNPMPNGQQGQKGQRPDEVWRDKPRANVRILFC